MSYLTKYYYLDGVVHKALLHLLIISCANIISPSSCDVDPKLLCTREYCKGQTCSPAPIHCTINNATHSGTNMLDISPCNCCEYCLVNLLEGQECSQGGLGIPPTGNVCGPGLSCQSTDPDEHPTCQRMKSTCHSAQDDYDERRDNGTLGAAEQRPECDGDGLYDTKLCIPGQTCYCQNSLGERIHGEIRNENNAGANMKCKCSRVADKAGNIKSGFTSPMRCNPDGSFDPLQCIDGRCFCIHSDSGTLSSSKIIDILSQPLTDLPCFDKSIHHSPNFYWRPCEEEIAEMKSQWVKAEAEGYSLLGNPFPNCQPDGWFGRTMELENKTICVDERGDQIDKFEADIGSEDAKNMDCKCARTNEILKSSQAFSVLPTCCPNGNWKKVQCRSGFCYCVDTNGIQQGMEVDKNSIDKLPCNAKPC